MVFIVLGFIIYVFFFIFFPGIGAVLLRKRWARFRKLIHGYSKVPILEYDNLNLGRKFSFTGKLESFKSDDIVWLRSDTLSLCINLKNQDVYSLSGRKKNLIKSRWDSVSSLVEGTPFSVFGYLTYIKGVPYLTGAKNEDLIVVISEGERSIFEMLLEKGRDKNEVWNSYTPYSYITGVLSLIILAYFSYRTISNKTGAFFLLLAAGTPFYFVIPPGLFLYLKYRKLWDRSIRWAILRDLKLLKGDYYSSDIMRIKSKNRERLSLLFYLCGYLLNIFIAGIILFNIFQIIIYN